MKLILALLLATAALSAGAASGPPFGNQLVGAKVSWDVVVEPICTGYVVLTGTAPHTYTQAQMIEGRENNSVTITNLPSGTNYIAVVASAPGGMQSLPSEPVTWANRLRSPTGVKVVTVITIINE